MFRERITRNYQSLSPSFKKIADFILTSHQRTAFLSASRLAKHLGLDVATVTRFAQQIGYDGYTELIREIQESVLAEMREARAHVTDRLESAEGPVMTTLWRDWANLEKTIKMIPPEDAQSALDALIGAKAIYLIAEGAAAGIAHNTGNYLSMSNPNVRVLVEGAFDVALALKELTADDVVIGIGFTNYAYSATRALEVAQKVGAKTIGVIGQADCPIGTVAEILLSCSATEEGYLPSPAPVASVLFALAYNYLVADADRYGRDLVRFQETYADLTEGTARGDEDVVEDLIGRF